LVRHRLKSPFQRIKQFANGDVFGREFELAGFNLGNIENVVDQVEQVIAGRINGLRELDLLFVEIALGVIRQQLGQDERAVKGRAQLVRHIGQKLGLVAAGPAQFLGPLFQ